MVPGRLDGPRRAPASGGKPNALVVFLHGYGSNGADLMGLAPQFARALPDAQFVGPNAIEAIPGYPNGYQWFPISRLDPQLMEQGTREAASVLDAFLDAELARYGLPASRLLLVGFSQGTMMALHVGFRRAIAPAGIIGFSGALPAAAHLKAEATCNPPVHLIHGDRDDVLPVGQMLVAGQAIAAAGHWCHWTIEHGLPHSIGPRGMQAATSFAQRMLAVRGN